MSDYDKFITPNFNRVKHGNGPFMTVDDKPVPHPSTQMQDSNNNISPISLTAIGIGMLSIVTMLVVRLRRGLQPATALGDNLMEMKSQDSNVKVNSDKVGWGQLSSQSPQPLTSCDASKQEMAALAEANPDFLGKSIGLWDPLNCLDFDFWSLGNEATIGYLRHAEIKHGRVAMAGFLGYIAHSTDLVSGPHTVLPFRGYEAGLTPPEQWDASHFTVSSRYLYSSACSSRTARARAIPMATCTTPRAASQATSRPSRVAPASARSP